MILLLLLITSLLSLTYTASLENNNQLPTWLNFDSNTRTFSANPTASDIGNISVKVTATDPKNAFNIDTFNINVVPPSFEIIPPGDTDYTYEFLSKEVAYKSGWVDGNTLQAKYAGTKFQQIAGDYVVDKVFDDSQTGFYALGLTSKTLSRVVVIRGTEINSKTDIYSDLNAVEIGFDQYQKNNKQISDWLAADSKLTDITGHSLGGALAQSFAADATSKGQKLGNIITFNSPGIAASAADKFKAENIIGTIGVKHYIVSGDFVSLGGEKFIPGGYKVFDFKNPNPASNHLNPILVSQVNYGENPASNGSTKAPDTKLLYGNLTDNSLLNNNLFGYFDPEHLAVLSVAEATISAASLINPLLLPLLIAPPSLLFRKTTETLRSKIGGDIATIGTFLDTSNIPVTGSFSAQDIKLIPKVWEIKETQFDFNTVEGTVSGSASILIPGGIIVDGSLGFASGQLDSIALNVDKLNTPIAATGASLQSIGGSIKNLTIPSLIKFGGKVGITDSFTGKLDISLPFPFDSLIDDIRQNIWALDITGQIDKNSLTGAGELTVLGGLAKGSATATLDWNKHLLSASTDLSILNGFISAKTGFIANSNSDLVLTGNATIKDPIGVFGAVNGKFKLQYINDNDASDDFVAGYSEVKTLFGDFYKSTKISFDGRIDWNAGKEIFAQSNFPTVARLNTLSFDSFSSAQPQLTAALVSANDLYTVEPNAQWLILNAEWSNSSTNAIQIRLKSPDGKTIDERDFAANNIAIVNELTDTTHKSVIIDKPLAGTWSLEVIDPAGLEGLQYRAFRDAVAPTIELDPLVEAGDRNFTINYKAIDSDSNAKVSLFYSNDPSNFNGALIKNDLPENDGVNSYSWNAKELAAGDYYVYASIDDGDTAPVLKYAPGKVTIANPVAINNAPVASKPLANVSAIQDKPFSLSLPIGAFTDPDDGDVLTYSATLVNGGTLPTWLKLDTATGTFTGTPTNTNLGSLQVKVTATDKANATASSTFALDVVNSIPFEPPSLTLQKSTTNNVWDVNGSGKIKVSLLDKNTSQLNEIGIFKVDANNSINGIAAGTAGFAKAAIESGSVVFSALPDFTTNGLDISHSFQVNNGDRLGFFLVTNGSVEDDLSSNNFSNVTTSLDLVNPYIVAPLKVSANQGAYTLNWNQSDDPLLKQDLSFNLQVDNTPNSLLDSISSQQGKKEGEVLDLREFAGQNVMATFNLKREAGYNDSVSFYKIDDTTGTVTSSGGQKFKPGDAGYVEAALANAIFGLNLAGKNGETVSVDQVIQGGSLYAPILMSNVSAGNPIGDNVFTAFSLGNADRTDHVRLLGGNTFGFEDLFDGGDKDFNDVIVQASFKTV